MLAPLQHPMVGAITPSLWHAGLWSCSPGHVHCGDVELDPFQPQHHEEALAEWAVPNVLSIQTSLQGKQRNVDLVPGLGSSGMPGGGEPMEPVSGRYTEDRTGTLASMLQKLGPAPGLAQLQDPSSEP